MKRILILVGFILFSMVASAAAVPITATVIDSDTTVWVNTPWSAVLSAGGTSFNGVTSNAGVLTDSTNFVSGSIYDVTICPNAIWVQCNVIKSITISTSGAFQTAINAGITAPRFLPSMPNTVSFGYADVEVLAPTVGDSYFNVISATTRYWCGTSGWGTTTPCTDPRAGNFTAVNASGAITQTGTSGSSSVLGGGGTIPSLVLINGLQTTDNKAFSANWSGNNLQLQFKADASNNAVTWLTASGGYATGITGITSNSGSGSWTHTGNFRASTLRSDGTTTSVGDILASGNLNVQGSINSAQNTNPASVTNSGVALTASPTVADELFYNSTYTVNNRIAEHIWFGNCQQLRFKSDDQATAVTPLSLCGGQGTGITGITSNSGSGVWTHTGNFGVTGNLQANGTSILGVGTQPTILTINGKSNGSLDSVVNIQDQTTLTGNVFSYNYLAPNLPAGGSLVHTIGKSGTTGNALVLFWNQTASINTNNWCLTVWGNGPPSNCTLTGYLNNKLVTKNNTLDDGSGNMTVAGTLAVNSSLACTANGTNCPYVPIYGTTGSIGGALLAVGACSTGTATIAGGVAGHTVTVSPSNGVDPGGGYVYRGVVTNATTVTVYLCATVLGTPTAVTYNIATY